MKPIGSATIKVESNSCPDIKEVKQNRPNIVKNYSSWIDKNKNFLTLTIKEAIVMCVGNLMTQTVLFFDQIDRICSFRKSETIQQTIPEDPRI